MPQLKAPLSTYRLQFNKNFRFVDATRLLDYLSQLGITDLYMSPILLSRKGSGHGYDVVDPTRIDPEIGTEEEFEALQSELAKRGMGLLLDIVPNHMAASSENRWWMDLLENGSDSAFAAYFDVDWQPASRNLSGKVLLPFLGRPFGEVLDSGELQLKFRDGKLYVCYFEAMFPIAPEGYHDVLNRGYENLKRELGEEHDPSEQELAGVLAGLAGLAEKNGVVSPADRRLKLEALRERLRLLVADREEIGRFIDARLKEFNGVAGDPRSFVLLERLLNHQHYSLAYWQDPNEGINYRRFFAITDLVGVRAEDPIVFEVTHDRIVRLVAKGANHGLRIGLRIDYIDGLRDPSGYLARLQQALAEIISTQTPKPYVIVEKILARGEQIPEDWPVAGTTGYAYMNYLQGPFVQPEGARQIERIYDQFVGKVSDFDALLYEKKKQVMSSLLGVEMRGLARQLEELAAKDRYARNIRRAELSEALAEITACMPVYRTYIRSLEVPPDAREIVDHALADMRSKRPQLSRPCLDFLRDVLTLASRPHIAPGQREERLAFVMRWQQFTGPIVAKGFEDTALYVYYPLSSLNEVGGNPRPLQAISREAFYEYLDDRRRRWPNALSATTTHDTKRSEDVRARVSVLSEIPGEWGAKIAEWAKLNAQHKRQVNGLCAPDANEEYLIYQTTLGIWPVGAIEAFPITKRLQQYMIKALREATIHTRWIKPNEAHEEGVARFVELILSPESSPEFLRDLRLFGRKIAWCGMVSALAQLLLKIVSPGTPDFYQGSELWDSRLVDPDNRTAVDFDERCKILRTLAEPSAEYATDLLHHWMDGHVKMYVTREALRYRLQHSELFAEGDFLPVKTLGVRKQHVVAILRRRGGDHAMAIVPRWLAESYTAEEKLPSDGFWGETSLALFEPAPPSWINVLTREQIETQMAGKLSVLRMAEVLKRFPIALLHAC
jgi:(1->4)-alpha-D-glucan 1-alpha-D-glucosylmutase